jgi:hypothetical protein
MTICKTYWCTKYPRDKVQYLGEPVVVTCCEIENTTSDFMVLEGYLYHEYASGYGKILSPMKCKNFVDDNKV